MRAWYLRRAVPWTVLLGSLAVGSVLVAAAHRWESFTGLGQPLTALLACGATALVLDESALAVTAVTPRSRWAVTGRLSTAVVPLAAGLALLAAAPGPLQTADWALVLAGAGGVALALALGATRRQVSAAGAAVMSTVVLIGIAPMVIGMFFDLRSPYPLPELDTDLRVFWASLGALAAAGCAVAVTGGVRR